MKLSTHTEALVHLQKVAKANYEKQAALAQTDIKSVPNQDVKSESAPAKLETFDQNAVGADKNKPQDYGQEASKAPNEPLKGAKSASVQELGKGVLQTLETAKVAAEAQTDIKSEPNKDVKSESVSDKLETTDQNAVGADKQNDKQEYKQEPSKAENEPLKGAKKAEANEQIAEKVASFQLGRQFAAAMLKQAAFTQVTDTNMLKDAGARDLELLIAQASENLEPEPEVDPIAKEAGYRFFEELNQKAAAESTVARENADLKQKLASYEAKFADLEPKVAGAVNALDQAKTAQEKQAAAELAAQEKKAFAAEVAQIAAAAVIEQLKHATATTK